MKTYHYHPVTKEYIGEGVADLSPLDLKNNSEVWLVPANATTIKPPENLEGKARVFVNDEWQYVEVEEVASNDIDNTSPSTETAFIKASKLINSMSEELSGIKLSLIEKEDKINELEKEFLKIKNKEFGGVDDGNTIL